MVFQGRFELPTDAFVERCSNPIELLEQVLQSTKNLHLNVASHWRFELQFIG